MKSRIWMWTVSIILITSVTGGILYLASALAPTPNGSTPTDRNYVYDCYGGVGLVSEGIHILATSQDPRTLVGKFEVANDFWKMLLESETLNATHQDFISILLSRGNKPTGGYNIQIENFAWLESFPAKFVFHGNFTDPDENVLVTQALTNPLVLVPIGRLTPGNYTIEVHIVQFIFSFVQFLSGYLQSDFRLV